MNNQEINVIAKLKVKKEVIEEAIKILKGLQSSTRKEPGCNMYQLHQSIEDATIFVLFESWIDKNSLDNHFQSPHFKSWLDKEKKYVAGPAEVTIVRKIN